MQIPPANRERFLKFFSASIIHSIYRRRNKDPERVVKVNEQCVTGIWPLLKIHDNDGAIAKDHSNNPCNSVISFIPVSNERCRRRLRNSTSYDYCCLLTCVNLEREKRGERKFFFFVSKKIGEPQSESSSTEKKVEIRFFFPR